MLYLNKSICLVKKMLLIEEKKQLLKEIKYKTVKEIEGRKLNLR